MSTRRRSRCLAAGSRRNRPIAATGSTAPRTSGCRLDCERAGRPNTSRDLADPAALPTERLRRLEPSAELRRQRQRRVGHAQPERRPTTGARSSTCSVKGTPSLYRIRSAYQLQPQRAADRPDAHLLRSGRRVRQPRPRDRRSVDGGPDRRTDGLQRFDVLPQVRFPFTRWPFLTINSSAGWRTTWWSESYDPDTINQTPPVSACRSTSRSPGATVDLQSTVTGPVFTRIFNTPGSGYADKFKHVIEPSVSIQRTTRDRRVRSHRPAGRHRFRGRTR